MTTVIEDGVEREIIKIACSEVDAGWRLGYRDTLTEGQSEYTEPQDGVAAVTATKTKQPAPAPAQAPSQAAGDGVQTAGWSEPAKT